ncbi:MAG TPA: glycosyltransferase [Pirellulaceae bacterium]|nr:glycosyltransferase [Pirellulaceae bacterium]
MPAVPRVSVLMPVLNPHPIYFREAVESVLNQTWSDFELLIIEAPGETSAGPLLANYHDERIRHLALDHRPGLVGQLNLGISQCSAEYIARMDADDICLSDRLMLQVALLDGESSVAAVGGQLQIINEHGQTIARRAYPCDSQAISQRLRFHNPLAHPSVMYRKSVVQAAGGYRVLPLRGVEDYDLWSRLDQQGQQLANLPNDLLRYRVHAGASKVTTMREQLQATIDLKREHYAGQLNLPARIRLLAERGLLLVPTSLVLWLFSWTQYRAAKQAT